MEGARAGSRAHIKRAGKTKETIASGGMDDKEVREVAERRERYEKRAIGIVPELESRVHEFLTERRKLEETIERKESMIKNKKTQTWGLMNKDGEDERKRNQITIETTR